MYDELDANQFWVYRHVHVFVMTALVATACGDSRPEESPGVAVPETAGDVATPKPVRASLSGKGPSGTMVVLEPLFEHENGLRWDKQVEIRRPGTHVILP